MRPPSIAALRAFSSAADFGSFRRAAEHLNLSESAISYQVRALEAAYGVKLFERDKATVRLTSQGRRYHDLIRQPLHDLMDATEQLSSQTTVTVLRLTMPPTIATHWLLPRLQHNPEKSMQQSLRLVTSDEILDLDRGDLELAIRLLPTATPPDNAIALFEEYVFPVTAPGYLSESIPLDALPLRNDLLLNESHLKEWHIFFDRRDLPPPTEAPANRLTGSDMTLAAAAAGLGIALARTPIVDSLMVDERLAAPFGTGFRSGYSYFLIIRDGAQARSRAKRLAEWIRSESQLYRPSSSA